jgi:hypothetical protein
VTPGGFVGYPMVEEADATGTVAAVDARLLEDMPFVPSLFTSLALCPGYLVLACEQAAGALSESSYAEAAEHLVSSARHAPWQVAADPSALEHAGLGDARPGMTDVPSAYLATLPRVLLLVASSTEPR